jgi:large subunit ribosomal protein L21
MDKYAIVKYGGKQLMVQEGMVFEIERQKDTKMDVMVFSDGEKTLVGEPYLSEFSVKAKILEDKKAKKVTVARFKSKSRYHKTKGHRQPVSVVKIEKIEKKAAAKKTEKKVKEEKK